MEEVRRVVEEIAHRFGSPLSPPEATARAKSATMLIFFSYKSEDVNLVRGVAERFIASGINVWLNEYRVMPERYEQFEADIDQGILESTKALVFTNNRWSDAEWCQYEMRGLLAHLHNRDSFVEVCIPKEDKPHAVFSELTNLQPIIFHGDSRRPSPHDLSHLVHEIKTRLGLPVESTETPIVLGSPIELPRFGTRLDVGPFQPSLHRTQAFLKRDPSSGTRMLVFSGTVGGVDVVMDLQVLPFASVLRDLSIRQGGAANDREVYLAYLKYAREWINDRDRRFPLRFKGLHLIFTGERSHIGLTYTSERTADGRTHWERRYTISIEGEQQAEKGEIGLVFAAWLDGSEQEQLEQFCRLSPQFEAIAQTVQYHSPAWPVALFSNIPILVSRSAYALGTLWLIGYLLRADKPPLLLGPACLVAGYFLGDIINVLVRPLYHRLLWTTQPLSDDLSGRFSYERFSTDLLHDLMSAPWWLLILLMKSFTLADKRTSYGLPWGVVTLVYLWLGISRIGTKSSPSWVLPAFVVAGVILGGIFAALAIGSYISSKKKQAGI